MVIAAVVLLLVVGVQFLLVRYAGRTGMAVAVILASVPATNKLAAEYPADLARAKAAGLPLSMSQLIQPIPPASQNAALVYARLGNVLKAGPAGTQAVIDSVRATWVVPSQEFAQLHTAVVQSKAAIALAHQAVILPKCVVARDWLTPDPFDISYADMKPVREAARYLTAQSLVEASEGKPLQAVQNESLCIRVATNAASDKTLLSYVVATAIDNETIQGFQNILYISRGDPTVAQAVEATLGNNWHPRNLVRAFKSECAIQQGTVAYLVRVGPSGLGFLEGSGPSLFAHQRKDFYRKWMDANSAYMLSAITKEVAAISEPYPQATADTLPIRVDMMRPGHPEHMVGTILLQVLSGAGTKQAQIRALVDVTRAGAAVLVWAAAHHSIPSDLSQVLKSVPPDPFDLQPLRYRREGAGFVVYSVGPTGKFDGGTPSALPDSSVSLFRYPEPAYAHG